MSGRHLEVFGRWGRPTPSRIQRGSSVTSHDSTGDSSWSMEKIAGVAAEITVIRAVNCGYFSKLGQAEFPQKAVSAHTVGSEPPPMIRNWVHWRRVKDQVCARYAALAPGPSENCVNWPRLTPNITSITL